MSRIEVRDTSGKVLPGIPTPRLIEAGGGEAFQQGDIWYLRERDYEATDGEYVRVHIVEVREPTHLVTE